VVDGDQWWEEPAYSGVPAQVPNQIADRRSRIAIVKQDDATSPEVRQRGTRVASFLTLESEEQKLSDLLLDREGCHKLIER
jgi:hypothetical protein